MRAERPQPQDGLSSSELTSLKDSSSPPLNDPCRQHRIADLKIGGHRLHIV